MAVRIQFRRGTAAEWDSANPTLAAGELGYEVDTSAIKIGNGVTTWSALGYSAVSEAYLQEAISGLGSGGVDLSTKADLNSPTFTGLTDFEGVVDFSGALVIGLPPTPETAPRSVHSFAMIG